jgi:hypothetical protein
MREWALMHAGYAVAYTELTNCIAHSFNNTCRIIARVMCLLENQWKLPVLGIDACHNDFEEDLGWARDWDRCVVDDNTRVRADDCFLHVGSG